MIKVYVAGAYSAPNVLDVFQNMGRGLRMSAKALAAKFAVYSPWCDCLLHLMGQQTSDLEHCYNQSIEWLKCADAVLVVEMNATTSAGTQRELEIARQRELPIFTSVRELEEWRDKQGPDHV